ncbi:MAG: anti-sigma factor domain-containing protein [Egibacteraceae bacterium]
MRPCDELRLELGAYVLGGLTDAEQRRVAEHLEACPNCRREYEELATLPRLLAHLRITSPMAPPAHLRARVLFAASRRRVRNRWLAAVAAAVVFGVLIGAFSVVWLSRSAEQPVVAVELESEARWTADGRAAFSWGDGEMTVRLTLRDLDPLHGDDVYEAWLAPVADGPPESIGTFEPDGDGAVDVLLRTHGPLTHWRSFWVTAEPNDTDPSHDGPTVVAAPIPPLP